MPWNMESLDKRKWQTVPAMHQESITSLQFCQNLQMGKETAIWSQGEKKKNTQTNNTPHTQNSITYPHIIFLYLENNKSGDRPCSSPHFSFKHLGGFVSEVPPTVVHKMLFNKEKSQRHDYINNDFSAGVGKEAKEISWGYDISPQNPSCISTEFGLPNCSVLQVKRQEAQPANRVKHWLFMEVHLSQLSGSKDKKMYEFKKQELMPTQLQERTLIYLLSWIYLKCKETFDIKHRWSDIQLQ